MLWQPQYEGEIPTLGWTILDWITENLIVPDGATAGEPLELTPEQARFILRLYEVDPNWRGPVIQGRTIVNARKVRRAVISRPKGWGKSPLLAALALVEALGPVVMDGWDANGEPVGRTWESVGIKPLVQIVAVSEDQTANTWIPCLEMAREGPVRRNYSIEPMEGFINVPNGQISAATAAGKSREGFRPVFYVMDQTESWIESSGGLRLAATLRRNVGKLGGLTVESPNGFIPGEESVAEHSYEAWVKLKEGKLRGGDGIYYDHREMPIETDTEDRESLRAGLAIAYGDSADVNGGWVDLDRIIEEYWDPDTDPMDAARYYGNQITAAADAWLSQPEWRGCMDLEKMIDETDAITLGFDGSRKRAKGVADATALIGCRVSDGHLFTIGIWEQPDGPNGRDWEVPRLEVQAAVAEAFKKYNVVGFYADPHRWESTISEWEAKYGEKLVAKATTNSPIVWDTRRETAMVRALEAMHAAILNRELSHDGNFALTRHFLNARRRVATNVAGGGYKIVKEHPLSARKIDAAIAATLAFRCRMDAMSLGVTMQQKRSKALIGYW